VVRVSDYVTITKKGDRYGQRGKVIWIEARPGDGKMEHHVEFEDGSGMISVLEDQLERYNG
jgi:hypothetical protein